MKIKYSYIFLIDGHILHSNKVSISINFVFVRMNDIQRGESQNLTLTLHF